MKRISLDETKEVRKGMERKRRGREGYLVIAGRIRTGDIVCLPYVIKDNVKGGEGRRKSGEELPFIIN